MSRSASYAKDSASTSLTVPPSDRVNDDQSPINTLPVELLLSVFSIGEPEITGRLILSHTCRRWRFIAIEAASLWTEVDLHVGPSTEKTTHNNAISLLEMQLVRAGELLLDVAWLGNLADYYDVRVLSLIYEKAPFSRWRTLELNLSEEDTTIPEGIILRSSDVFTNLESLSIIGETFIPLYQRIGERTTSRLRRFDAGPDDSSLTDISHRFPKVLRNISSLVLHSQESDPTTPPLPSNITEVKTSSQRAHPFPHIRAYHLALCLFWPNREIGLGSLTTFTVTSLLVILPNCKVVLPSLLHFAHGILRLSSGSKIELPGLETLRILAGTGEGNAVARITSEYDTLRSSGYLFSAKKSLFVDLCLPEDTTILLLEKSPYVKRAVLTFNDKQCARKVMKEIVEGGTVKGSRYRSSKRLCPGLSELRMNFEWEIGDEALWKGRSLKAVEARKEDGITLSIYASWKGEGTYVALA